MILITHVLKKTNSRTTSIERIFEDVRAKIGSIFDFSRYECKYYSTGIVNRILNIYYVSFKCTGIIHVTGDIHYVNYFLPYRKSILTILDCINIHQNKGLKRFFTFLFWYWIPVRRAVVITTISEATKNQIIEFTGISRDKVVVIHCGLSAEFQASKKLFNENSPLALLVGSSENKNHMRHLEALVGTNSRVLFLGKPSDELVEKAAFLEIPFEFRLELSRAQVVNCYIESDFLLFASLYEGFGLPIIEAQAVGRPVITSQVWSMPEIAGNAATLVDPYSVESIAEAVNKTINDRTYREKLIKLGYENIKRFDPEFIANKYRDLYLRIHKESVKR